jgi:hypothetical protein
MNLSGKISLFMIGLVASAVPAAAIIGGPFSGNDRIATAQQTLDIPGVPLVTWTGSTAGFTTEPGELLPCLMTATGWFSFVGIVPGIATVDTFTSNYDTVLAAYSGAPGATTPAGLSFLTCNDDFGGLQSQISFPVSVGTTYYVQVGSWFFPGAGGTTIHFR